MRKLQDYWMARNRAQQAVLVASFLGSLFAIILFAWFAARPPLALLYTGLDTARAGEVMAEIDRRGVAYEVRGESIWVAASDRDRLRLDLAAQGLPQDGGTGYELLDGMSGFGTTSQMFDAAYWRAKEGELARTILALPNVKAARVHLAVPSSRGLRRETAGTASVTVTTNGIDVAPDQARSLQFLVASGVPGMASEAVTVIDSRRGVVSPGHDRSGSDREAELRGNVERLLAAHVGPGNAIVELHLALDTDREQLVEQRFDPKERALISEDVSETSDQSSDGGPAAVTAASNLPDDSPTRADGQSRANRQETRQRANYEVSQLTREVLRQPGEVKRLTAAVLVNGVAQADASGKTQIVARGEAELGALRELVASAIGFDEARGDQLTIKSMPFADLAMDGTLAERPGWVERLALGDLVRLGLVGLFAVAIALIVLRPVLVARAAATEPEPPRMPLPALRLEPSTDTNREDGNALPPPETTEPGATSGDQSLAGAAPELSLAAPTDNSGAVARLREMMRERREESVRLLSEWIGEPGGSA